MPREPRTLAERLWAKVDVRGPDECWVWKGRKHQHGYGLIGVGHRLARKDLRTHRVAYELTRGPIPQGLGLLHSCDNPPCCNPAHLRPGTQAENVADMKARGRIGYTGSPGESHPSAKLTRLAVEEMRRLRGEGKTLDALARAFGVGKSTTHRVCSGKAWLP